MIFQSNDDPNVEKDIINSLISLRVAGVAASVGLRTSSTEHFDRLTEENIPLVISTVFRRRLSALRLCWITERQ